MEAAPNRKYILLSENINSGQIISTQDQPTLCAGEAELRVASASTARQTHTSRLSLRILKIE